MKFFITVLLFLSLFSASQLHAAPLEPVPLPVLTVVNSTGAQVTTEGVGKEKGVVLVLVRKGNPAGDKLLSLLEEASKPFPADRLLVVVGGADEKVLAAVMERHRRLTATWYCDADDLLAKGLKLKGSPMLVGVGDGMVAWNIPGSNNLVFLEKTVRGWLNR